MHLVTESTRNQYQEIIDKAIPNKDSKNYCDVRRKFKEKAPSVIEKMKMEKLEAELEQRQRNEELINKTK